MVNKKKARLAFTEVGLLLYLIISLSMMAIPPVASGVAFTRFQPRLYEPEFIEPAIEASPAPSPDPSPPSKPKKTTVRRSAASATWYCLPGVSRCTIHHSGGLYAAISPDLRWLGRRLRVCTEYKCIVVKVIDCNCQAKKGIDLYSDAFRLLAPLSDGRIRVTLTGL